MMAERRPLVEGLQTIEEVEKSFVYGGKVKKEEVAALVATPAATSAPVPAPVSMYGAGRIPLTTRVKPELASSLKRISLERQLAGIQPCSMQDIVEEALELWLVRQNQGKI
ncbi:MAG: hypothetical protein R3B84_09455 [Zavarzinella sp.]